MVAVARQLINPILDQYIRQRQVLVDRWRSNGIYLSFDQKGENLAWMVKFEFQTRQGYQQKMRLLKNLEQDPDLFAEDDYDEL